LILFRHSSVPGASVAILTTFAFTFKRLHYFNIRQFHSLDYKLSYLVAFANRVRRPTAYRVEREGTRRNDAHISRVRCIHSAEVDLYITFKCQPGSRSHLRLIP